MKRSVITTCLLFFAVSLFAQSKPANRKYPSLLWEITGNGLKKPSHLIGTMHVSNKLVFNLPDSFYLALRNAQVVALETNPETWQEDMDKYDINESGYDVSSPYSGYLSIPNDYLSVKTLQFFKYDNKIARALYSNSSTINNLLYRTYGNESSDFEEDTYLDMYIYQCGKKWGKKVTGVEDYGQSMRLMAEAYRDGAKDKKTKERSYGNADDAYSSDKLQEAYRTGNLDLLDSINRFNSSSDAFDEKFLYRRNEIQAHSIDSILRSGTSLFVGVGAAHLPGDRGVIEILRRLGYKLRPVKMGERASREKEMVDKIRVPVVFRTETAEDGLFKVDIPGTFYKFGDDPALEQRQYADMANGSYYMVTRIMTNAWMWNHSTDDVYRTIDSLLYENVPGKILSKTAITRNGYRGFDITNRTRRGDLQRYQIYITPFEILFFKMSGNGEYVRNGTEANRFFNSIQLKEYRNTPDAATAHPAWKKYSPVYGGFSIDLPHDPYIGNDGSWIFDATDKSTNTNYRVIRTDVHNYRFVEEDTFDLSLMEESFAASEFIDSQVQRKLTVYKGYPALDARFRDKDGGLYLTRFIIQGPHYYTLVAHGKQELPAMNNFLNSFELLPYRYGEARTQRDTSLYFSVQTPVYPESKKIKLDMPMANSYYNRDDDGDDDTEDDLLEAGTFRSKVIRNDSTGERIFVSFYRIPRYYYTSDSSAFDKDNEESFLNIDSSWIIYYKNKQVLPNHTKVWEVMLTDTGSSRTLWTKSFYKDGIAFSLTTQSDTLSKASPFVRQFYDSFNPADSLKGVNPFEKKSTLFFNDLFSKDTVLHKRAIKHVSDMTFDSTDLPQLKKAIASLSWTERKYLDTKTSFINRLRFLKTKETSDYLRTLYYALDDTVELQYATLENLLQQKTAYAFSVFRDIINTEPPVINVSGSGYNEYSYGSENYDNDQDYPDGKFLDELNDSLKLTRTILPDVLQLLNLDDYKSTIMKLLGRMVDSNLVKPSDYSLYFSKFLIEAKQELKKQSIAEKKKAIEKAEENKTEPTKSIYSTDENNDAGNDDLSLYANLLLPYWELNNAVPSLIRQMLSSNDRELKYNTLLLLIRQNRPYPDTMLTYFANQDPFRYRLYDDLKTMRQLKLFPASYMNPLYLAKSELIRKSSYSMPDSVVYIDRLQTTYKEKTGYIYFYKYKMKKDDLTWRIATVGLVPLAPGRFEFDDSLALAKGTAYDPVKEQAALLRYNFTGYTQTKLAEEEPILPQLRKQLKKMLFSRRKSARNFYDSDNEQVGDVDYGD